MHCFKVSTALRSTTSLHFANVDSRKRPDIHGRLSWAGRIVRCGILATAAGLSNAVLANGAHATTTPVAGVSLYVQAQANSTVSTDTEVPPATSVAESAQANGGAVVANGQAQYGVLHAQAGSKTISDSDFFNVDPLTDGKAYSTVAFQDVVLVSDPHAAAGDLVPTKVLMSMNGTYVTQAAFNNNPFIEDQDAQIAVEAAAQFTSLDGTTVLGSAGAGFEVENDDGTETTTSLGSNYSFTVMLQNDMTYQYFGSFFLAASASQGGSASVDYGDTAFFTVTSPDPDVRYTGSTGTDYSNLVDNDAPASAPEPGALALMLPVLLRCGRGALARKKQLP